MLICTVYNDNYEIYGARKIWAERRRQGQRVARCTVSA
jgi:putative transposase